MMRPPLHPGQLFEVNSTLRCPRYDVGNTHTYTHIHDPDHEVKDS